MCIIYCVLQRRLKAAQRINTEMVNQIQVTNLQRRIAEEQKQQELAAKKKRVLAHIKQNLLDVAPADLEDKEETCGICICSLIVESGDDS